MDKGWLVKFRFGVGCFGPFYVKKEPKSGKTLRMSIYVHDYASHHIEKLHSIECGL